MSARHIVLTDDGVTVAHNALHRLMAVCFFPESLRDQAQAIFIADMERAEFLRVTEAHYLPSAISQAVIQMAEKQNAQFYIAGFVTLSLIWLGRASLSPSLRRAATVAGYAASEFNKITSRSGFAPRGKDRVQAVTGDPASVAKIFRRYRSVAHIMAARVSAASYLEPLHIWDQPPLVVASMIQTCAAIQVELEKFVDTRKWNLWDVTRCFPTECSDMPVLQPDHGIYGLIEQGFALAESEGAISVAG
jgi:hypothetical protein